MAVSDDRSDSIKSPRRHEEANATGNENRAAMGANLRRPFEEIVMLLNNSVSHNSAGEDGSPDGDRHEMYRELGVTEGMRHE